ncbi:uncharacterized protein LOC122249500 [Penaeus japonicus]|uniref:uncharacterized protein LOC122249500 n=1 Tax=Penaeus japonicus TaxID=27405 RepID=UPI001C70C354|nr:uncharacterized protein LOC122249500 [Penaeus japonicus]
MFHAFISVIFLAFAVSPSVQVCAPHCTGVDPGTKVRDPTDCTRYYICLDASGNGELVPSIQPVQCPDDHYFNDRHSIPRCDPIVGAPSDYCTQLCNPCLPHCTEPYQVTPHHNDCSVYYVCLDNSHLIEVGCPQELPFFDFISGSCQNDETLCFHYCDPCEPHCTEQNERIADPSDCHRFYLCTPPTMSSFLCPHNQVFSTVTLQCEEDAPCVTVCPNV